MDTKPGLDQLLDVGTDVTVGGKTYRFGELTLGAMARLQGWIKSHVPNPLAALRGELDGFTAEEKAVLLEGARKEAQHWPPVIGSPDAARHLFSSPDGHRALLKEALLVHQPEIGEAEVERLYRRIRFDEALSTRIMGLAFGRDLDQSGDGEDATRKNGCGRTPDPLTGHSSSGSVSSG